MTNQLSRSDIDRGYGEASQIETCATVGEVECSSNLMCSSNRQRLTNAKTTLKSFV